MRYARHRAGDSDRAEEYGPRFRAALPAPVLLFADSADSQTRKSADRARLLLAGYGAALRSSGCRFGGESAPGHAVQSMTSTSQPPTGRAVVVLGSLTYFVLLPSVGRPVPAIDSTAGEREAIAGSACSAAGGRGSLVGGKILATCSTCARRSPSASRHSSSSFRFVSLERLGMSAKPWVGTALAFFAICLPFVPLGAALYDLRRVGSPAATREAQTYLTTVLLVPTLPIAFASIYSLKTRSSMMFIHP